MSRPKCRSGQISALPLPYRSLTLLPELGFELKASTPEQCVGAALVVERAQATASQGIIEECLGQLSVMVIRKQEDEFTQALQLEIYTRKLEVYPADVVRYALLEQCWNYWSTWEEFHKICEQLAAPRRKMLAALRAKSVAEPTEEAPRKPANREQVKSILDEIGFTLKRFEAVQARPMARTEAELSAALEDALAEHWTSKADPDGPDMRVLQDARRANLLMYPGIEQARRDTGNSLGRTTGDGTDENSAAPIARAS